jgi:hypothetical protein
MEDTNLEKDIMGRVYDMLKMNGWGDTNIELAMAEGLIKISFESKKYGKVYSSQSPVGIK